jgi:hypothetical protein
MKRLNGGTGVRRAARWARAALAAALAGLTGFLWKQPAQAAFEPLGYGAAAKGMGGAYTAAAVDGTAAYWNPAGLALLKAPELTASLEDLYGLGLLRYTAVGYAHPGLGGGTFGLHLLRLQTTGEASFYTYAENTYLLAHGRPLWRAFYGGAALRYYAVAAEQKGSGIGLDAGLLYRPRKDRYRLSLAVQDINQPKVRYGTGSADVLPWGARFGGLVKVGGFGELTAEENWRENEARTFRLGFASYFAGRRIVLRTGAHRADGQDEWNFAMGGGFRFKRLRVDYAWDHNDRLGNAQTIDFAFAFGP